MVSSVIGPGVLTKNVQPSTAGENPTSAPADDPMLPAMNGMEEAMLAQPYGHGQSGSVQAQGFH